MVQGSLARPGAPVEMQKQPQRVKPLRNQSKQRQGQQRQGWNQGAAPRTRAEAELTQALTGEWHLTVAT